MRETRLNQTELHVTPYEKHIMWRRRRSMLSGLAIRWEYNNFIPGRRLPPMIRRWYTLSSNTSWEERWCRHNLWYFFSYILSLCSFVVLAALVHTMILIYMSASSLASRYLGGVCVNLYLQFQVYSHDTQYLLCQPMPTTTHYINFFSGKRYF